MQRRRSESVVVTDTPERYRIGEDLLSARPDPFCEIQNQPCSGITTATSDVVARLVSRLPAPRRGPSPRSRSVRRPVSQCATEPRHPLHRSIPVDDMTEPGHRVLARFAPVPQRGLRARRRRHSRRSAALAGCIKTSHVRCLGRGWHPTARRRGIDPA